ncbi:Cation efflux protein [Mycena venus]|uniref:Cation efflux protein n=1 Tax=Mycena venus TaxID=2733690 RepID=A0A8H6YBZ4_9AGAR|nr:Cation efflux protein [Mycena venus]
MSRSSKIKVLLAIDVVFFFVELISGYAVGSLALVADSFHMLNDVMSLIVALYAIKLTSQSATDSRYSYGWHRAEILAALVNGVFLLALCFSIALEAMERFFSTPEISNPKLVIIVGSFGLASNLVGLFLFHEHTHSHSHGHSHSHSHSLSDGHSHGDDVHEAVKPPSASVPIRGAVPAESDSASESSDEDVFPAVGPGHPAMTRASIVRVAHNMARAHSPHSPTASRRGLSFDDHSHSLHHHPSPSEDTPLLAHADSSSSSAQHAGHSHSPEHANGHSHSHSPSPASNSKTSPPDHAHGHGHSHAGSMNMRALVLHVIGDALGNVGVIATGLIILLAPASWGGREVYFDPAISLVIACIILGSAVPLVRSASFVLLQGVPATISLEQVRAAILAVEGVQSLHELHIWQLSESKNIASVHVLASRELDFMPIAAKIRKALHDHGIHSCTIQPEYYGSRYSQRVLEASPDTACLVLCPPEECNPQEDACCPPPAVDV